MNIRPIGRSPGLAPHRFRARRRGELELRRGLIFLSYGVKGYEADLWFGILAPVKTSGAIVEMVNSAVRATLSAGETRDRMVEQSAEIVAGTPDQFTLFIKAEIAKWSTVVKATGLRAE